MISDTATELGVETSQALPEPVLAELRGTVKDAIATSKTQVNKLPGTTLVSAPLLRSGTPVGAVSAVH
ncbi:hypothetical protein, partial [Arthrobacter sp. JCM 19049]|uniref:hypothetical protein n=1 Tax=Arthrobacter sp. JCM 19049 TaxID=1460643 RepID=UPI000A854D94